MKKLFVKGYKRSPEVSAKILAKVIGRKRTLEARKKMSDARKGRFKGKDNPAYKHGLSSTKEMSAFYQIRREFRKISNGGHYTIQEWRKLKERVNHTCLCCKRKEPEITLSPDHIIPISKGGSSKISNIQPLCRSCNYKKYNKIISYA